MKAYSARRQGNAGFSLVELMVAMVIGLLVLLGAGRLFDEMREQFREVQRLTMAQSTLQVAADMLAGDIRRAEQVILPGGGCSPPALLCLDSLPNRSGQEGCGGNGPINREYRLSSAPREQEGYELMQRQQCPVVDPEEPPSWGGWEPVVAGFAADGVEIENASPGGAGNIVTLRVSFCLIRQHDITTPCGSYEEDNRWLRFHVVNRSQAVTI